MLSLPPLRGGPLFYGVYPAGSTNISLNENVVVARVQTPIAPGDFTRLFMTAAKHVPETVKGAFETQDTFETLSFYDNYFMVIWILLFTFAPDKKEPYEESICHQRICGPRILL